MTPINIKLYYTGDGIKEETTFTWLNDEFKFNEIKGEDYQTGQYSSSNPYDHVFEDERDTRMVEAYLKMYGKDLLVKAKEANATICFKKEIWFDNEPAMEECWLEVDNCEMMKRNIKLEFCNNILPLLTN